ncbi:MAG: hypothetical protein EOM18_01950 [Clostridia bacterium]|nr:hypothetical protein [Clostridia bacterium]
MIKDYFKNIGWKRILFVFLGNMFIGMGVSIFKLARLGNDAFNGMVMSLSDCLGIAYGNFFVVISVLFFIIQLTAGREFIGIGTVVNAFLQGYIATFFYNLWIMMSLQPKVLLMQIIVMCVGVVICAFGISMYQSANAGVASYDSLPLILAKRIKKVPYFAWRMLIDIMSALTCYLSGGLIGIGTLVCTFGFGPIIHFFNINVMRKLLKEKK